jgi:predicted CopG family antitoxin
MSATKRIPVSEETWKELGKKKETGQTWDDLLEQLHIKAMKNQVASKATRAKDGDLETVSPDDV